MNETIESYLALLEQDKRDVFEAAASRLDTLPSYVDLLLLGLVVSTGFSFGAKVRHG